MLHACDEIFRWLWENLKEDQAVDRVCLQKSSFNGEKQGYVVVVLLPVSVGVSIDRELALDSLRSLETLVWRYGGHGLECEIWSGGKFRGRISASIKVFKAQNVLSERMAGASST